jgi:pyridoxamine 5'-phosphate oxidase
MRDRASLDDLATAAETRFAGIDVACPDDWGGFRLRPERWEFWQGRPNRLHDRVRYSPSAGGWLRERLAP